MTLILNGAVWIRTDENLLTDIALLVQATDS